MGYKECKQEVGGDITVKISFFSDKFDKNKNYAGMIVYKIDNKCNWLNQGGKAKGWKGRSFYVAIQSTMDWPDEEQKEAGEGRVHSYLVKNVLGQNHGDHNVACAGFAFHNGELKYSSIWLNKNDQTGGKTDGSKYLSAGETILAKYIFEEWKKKGVHVVLDIPSGIEKAILNA